MPIYEYICEKCGAHTEVIQKISDAPLKRCKKCRGKLEKIVSRSSFQLKGSGWYQSDYSSQSKAPSSSEPSKTSEEKKTEEKKTEEKKAGPLPAAEAK